MGERALDWNTLQLRGCVFVEELSYLTTYTSLMILTWCEFKW